MAKLGFSASAGIAATDLGGGQVAVGGVVVADQVGLTVPVGGGTLEIVLTTDNFTFNCDLDRDGDVDWNDVTLFVSILGSSLGQANYHPRADFDLSGIISSEDATAMLALLETDLGANILFGDVTDDEVLDCLDNCDAVSSWGSVFGGPAYSVRLDFDLDGDNDAADRQAFVASTCPADFNQSGAVSVQDVFDFLTAHQLGDPSTDINHDGMVTVQDIFDFLGFYFGSPQCP